MTPRQPWESWPAHKAEERHTPGPWKVRGTRIYRDAPGIDCICTMQVSNQPNWDMDAALIAACPELLEALILMVRAHDEPAETLRQEAKEQQWLAKARAAIAKALGSAS